MPVVSVVLPTYNRSHLLRQAVASVVGQTFTNWELLVADDGSTDGTRAFLDTLRDSRIRPLLLEHSGRPGRVRGAALRRAQGEWVAFLDSDDLWLPAKLATQLSQFGSAQGRAWSYTGYQLEDLKGNLVPLRPPGPYQIRSGWILEQVLAYEVSAAMPTVLARRSTIEEIGGFDDTLHIRDDYDLVVRLAAHAECCAVDEALTIVRDHGGRTTSAQSRAVLFRENERVFRKMARKTTDARIRRVCIRQCSKQLTSSARALSLAANHGEALADVGRALRDAPFSTVAWRTGAGCLLRAAGLRRHKT